MGALRFDVKFRFGAKGNELHKDIYNTVHVERKSAIVM